jgi:hypothetical protein
MKNKAEGCFKGSMELLAVLGVALVARLICCGSPPEWAEQSAMNKWNSIPYESYDYEIPDPCQAIGTNTTLAEFREERITPSDARNYPNVSGQPHIGQVITFVCQKPDEAQCSSIELIGRAASDYQGDKIINQLTVTRGNQILFSLLPHQSWSLKTGVVSNRSKNLEKEYDNVTLCPGVLEKAEDNMSKFCGNMSYCR